MTNNGITGVLRNAKRITSIDEDHRAPCLRGEIYGDSRGRFPDGSLVFTSTITAEDGDTFTTRNSVYKVESWAGAKPAVSTQVRANQYDKTDTVRRLAALIAGPMKLAAYTVLDPETGEHGDVQFHMTYNNTVMAVLGEQSARLFVRFVNENMPDATKPVADEVAA